MRSFHVILIVWCLFILNSCQKKFEEPRDAPADTTVIFKAKINTVPFSAVLSGASIRPDSVISIAGQSADGQTLAFTLKDSGVHVYDLDMNSTTNFCSYEDSRNYAFSTNQGYKPGDAGGKLSIVLLDRVKRFISGTFKFTVYREDDNTQRTITDGIFNNIRY
ncbi:MAG: DUF6252 family protein [Bacteroidota bacterium]|nr:DUF6252 family protein [Bacteroidota bacterium]